MEWKAKGGLLATMKEKQELNLHFKRLKNKQELLEKSFNVFLKVGQLMYAKYIIHKNAYLSLLESLRHKLVKDHCLMLGDLSLKVHLRRLHFQQGVDHSFPLFKPINVALGCPEKLLGKLNGALLINGNQSEGPIRNANKTMALLGSQQNIKRRRNCVMAISRR